MNIGGVGTSGTRSPRARVRSSVRAECRVPRHRLAASVRARAVDDVHARSRVPEADCRRRDEKPRGSPRHRKVVDSLSRSRARRSRFGETIAVGAVPRAPPAVAVSLRETRGRRRRPRPGFTRHRERRDEGAFATRPRSAGGARRARPVAPRRSVDPAPQHRGVTRLFPSGRDRALTTLPFDTLHPVTAAGPLRDQASVRRVQDRETKRPAVRGVRQGAEAQAEAGLGHRDERDGDDDGFGFGRDDE